MARHMTPETFTCQACFKDFSRKGDLTRHANIHAGYKPHKCNDCGRCFTQFSGLKTHRNIHTKIKPFLCGMDKCKAAFGDPSSRARHCKETHRTLGAYHCPVPNCKSSIKRRSAFTLHLRKHNIDPDTVDIDALAPHILPRIVTYQRKPLFQKSPREEPRPTPAPSEVVYLNGSLHARYDEPHGPVYHPIPHLSDAHIQTSVPNSWPPASIELPALPASGLFTIDVPVPPRCPSTEDFLTFNSSSPTPFFVPTNAQGYGSPSSNPGLSYSPSPSPPRTRQFLQPNGNLRSDISTPSTPTPSPHRQSPVIFFTDPTPYAEHDQQSQPEWDFEASIFGTSSRNPKTN